MLTLALAIAGLAACSQPDPPPAPMAEVPLRAPTTPPAVLLVGLPGVAPVPRALTAELTRGAEAVCAPLVGTVLDPVGEDRFRLLLNSPGFVVTRESVLRRTVAGPPDAPELALDGANNGRCDYLFRVASR
jgi:hypothetical protein